jgi:3-hydroxyisobutyrate dehydrogenase-like beta-hydroxyacid dehydrogenase
MRDLLFRLLPRHARINLVLRAAFRNAAHAALNEDKENGMEPVVVVIAMGEMGAGIAGRLSARGAKVRTSLKGRSAASAARAKAAGVAAIDDERALLDGADFVLSVIPPGEARNLAKRLLPALQAHAKKPVYVDCNAIAPDTAREVAAILAPAGGKFVDGGIIGSPPRGDGAGPCVYVSGDAAEEAAGLARYGLDMRVIAGGIGAASALKLSYASLTKGLVALGSESILSAERAGVGAALKAELMASQPQIFAMLQKRVPDMVPKAYRWVAEMEEIAAYFKTLPSQGAGYRGAARLYENLADAVPERGKPGNPIAVLEAFLGVGKTG